MKISGVLTREYTIRLKYRRAHELSKAILYEGKPLDLNNTFINSQNLEKFFCQVLVLLEYNNLKI